MPASADPKAPPQSKVTDRSASVQWHDHAMHWMGQGLPPQVKDKSKRTKVYDYSIPIEIGGTPGAIKGTLFWQPESGGAPVGMFVGLGVLAVLALGVVALARRRRHRGPAGEAAEAW